MFHRIYHLCTIIIITRLYDSHTRGNSFNTQLLLVSSWWWVNYGCNQVHVDLHSYSGCQQQQQEPAAAPAQHNNSRQSPYKILSSSGIY